MYKVIIIALIVTVIAIVAFAAVENVTNQMVGTTSSSLESDADTLSITISGEVTRPGTYILEVGSTLNEVLKKASGATSNADPLSFNTDYVCENGMP